MSDNWERRDTSRITPEYDTADEVKEIKTALSLVISVCQEALEHPENFDTLTFGIRRKSDDWFRIIQAGDLTNVARLVEKAQERIIRAAIRAGVI